MTRKIRTTNAKVRSVAKPYEPTPGERLLMESYFARQAQTPAAPRLKVSDDSSGATEIAPDHPDPRMAQALLMEALATTDACFVVGLIGQLADAGTRRRRAGTLSRPRPRGASGRPGARLRRRNEGLGPVRRRPGRPGAGEPREDSSKLTRTRTLTGRAVAALTGFRPVA